MENIQELKDIIQKQQEEIDALKHQNEELTAKLNFFMEQFKLNQNRQFGKSSEQNMAEQLNIFNEAEVEAKPDIPEPTIEEITYKRKKRQGQREELLKDLPVEVIEYKLSEEEQICPCCNGDLHEMSTETRREIKYIPATVGITEHVSYIYSCRNCEKNEISTPVIKAPMPKPAIPGSIASASIISGVMTEKFVKGLPLYRQEQEWERNGIGISRQTMSNWMLISSDRWLRFIYDRMHDHLLKRNILQADETTLQVLNEPGREAGSKSYMWLYRTGRDAPAIVLYDYQTTRAGKHAKNFLDTFKGYLNADGYAGYDTIPGIILIGCWSHARRGYTDAIKAMPKIKKEGITAAEEGLAFCDKLFSIERELHDVSSEERYERRLKLSKPVLDDFQVWLKYQSPRVVPKSALGKAVKYCRNQWKKLNNFLLDGRLEIDNNRSERSIKPFVIGRKGWMFNKTPKGAKASATIYSIVESAKENDLIPYEYIKYLLEKLPNIDITNTDVLDGLMPWSETLHDVCRSKKSSD